MSNVKIELVRGAVKVQWPNGSATIRELLSKPDTNKKLALSESPTWGLSMTPHVVRGLGFAVGNVCPFASTCVESCLTHTGMGYHSAVQRARLARRLFWQFDRDLFLKILHAELTAISARNLALGISGLCRLNVFSDIRWERYLDLASYTGLSFYDYTKWPCNRRSRRNDNYRLVYSFDGTDESREYAIRELMSNGNVAVVFHDGVLRGRCGKAASKQPLPETWEGFPVIDGNVSDDRTADARGSVIGLTLKARTIADRQAAIESGFAQLHGGN